MPVRTRSSTKRRPTSATKPIAKKTVAKKTVSKKPVAKKKGGATKKAGAKGATKRTTVGKAGGKKTKPATKARVSKGKSSSKRPTARASAASTRPGGRGVAGQRARKPGARRRAAAKAKPKSALPRLRRSAVKTAPLRKPLTGTPIPNRARRKGGAREDRVTPLVNRAPVEAVPEVAGFRPSRILTTRPRPMIKQFDPSGRTSDGPRTLQPWEVEVDDLAELMAARAAEEKAAEEANARFVKTPQSAQARIEEARQAGWQDDSRPTRAGLPDERVRLVHPHAKFIDGAVVRDVALSVHPASGRATLLLEGGPRLRTASFRMREGEELPVQVARLVDDPARLARAEHASGQDLLAELEALDRAAVRDLRELAAGDRAELGARLRAYIRAFAATHASFGLPATVDGVWERFGVRRDSVLERLGLAEEARRAVADAFDAALDQSA